MIAGLTGATGRGARGTCSCGKTQGIRRTFLEFLLLIPALEATVR